MPENPEHEGGPRLLTIDQIAEEQKVSRSALHTYRRSGTFPQPVPVEGTTRVLFDAGEVAAWFEANPKQQGKKRGQFVSHTKGEPVTTTVDPRVAILSALNDPPYNEVAEKQCVPWDEAAQMLDTYRAKELRMAAEAIEQEFLGPADSERDQAWNDAVKAAATVLRQMASTPEETGE